MPVSLGHVGEAHYSKPQRKGPTCIQTQASRVSQELEGIKLCVMMTSGKSCVPLPGSVPVPLSGAAERKHLRLKPSLPHWVRTPSEGSATGVASKTLLVLRALLAPPAGPQMRFSPCLSSTQTRIQDSPPACHRELVSDLTAALQKGTVKGPRIAPINQT